MTDKTTYLGDGVYAGFDGDAIWLMEKLSNGWNRVILEPDTLEALIDYSLQSMKDEAADLESGNLKRATMRHIVP